MQVRELAIEVLLVVPPCQPVHARRGMFLQFEERRCEMLDADVVEERGELLLLPFPCHFPYTVQRCSTLIRFCARHVLCCSAFPLVPALGSAGYCCDRVAEDENIWADYWSDDRRVSAKVR
jgi:hypothetical protein